MFAKWRKRLASRFVRLLGVLRRSHKGDVNTCELNALSPPHRDATHFGAYFKKGPIMSDATAPGQERLLTSQEAADFLRLTPRFLEMRRFRGGGPPFIRVSGRCVRYLKSDLREWVEGLRRTSTSDLGPPPVSQVSQPGLNPG